MSFVLGNKKLFRIEHYMIKMLPFNLKDPGFGAGGINLQGPNKQYLILLYKHQ